MDSEYDDITVNLDNKKALECVLYLQTYLKEEEENKKKIRSLEEENIRLTKNNKELNNYIKNLNVPGSLQVPYNEPNDEYRSLLVQKQKIEKELEEKNKENNNLSQTIKNNLKTIEIKENDIKELTKINTDLKEQASKYQAALGAATNFRLGDDDKNNSVQLKDDILRLQDDLELYVTNLRPKIEINLKNINNLLVKYQSKTKVTSSSYENIPLIKAVLQRHVIETIFSYVQIYISHIDSGQAYALEAQIAYKTDELIQLANQFVNTREGNDNITSAVPVKIRQRIYSALGNRGFSNIINEQQKDEHTFINRFKTELNEEMEQYRKILDITKKKEIEEKAATIILDVIRIFYCRLRTQEPMVQMRWFNYKDKIDSSLMNGMWDDEESDDIEVDICKFPLIGIELTDILKRKIYTHAIIHPRSITNSEDNSEINSEGNNNSEVKPEVKSEEIKPEVKSEINSNEKSQKKEEIQKNPSMISNFIAKTRKKLIPKQLFLLSYNLVISMIFLSLIIIYNFILIKRY